MADLSPSPVAPLAPPSATLGLAWQRLRRNWLSATALVIIVLMALAAVLAGWVAPYEPDATDADAARVVGNPAWRIIFIHLLPNCLPPIIVQATLAMGYALLTMAALSFIGLGIQPPQSEWGSMTAEGAQYIVTGEWWLFLFPGLAIVLMVLSFNLIGDSLRDFLDPRMRGVR